MNNLSEELVDADALAADPDIAVRVLADMLVTYQTLLTEENLIDFSAIQTECYRLLTEKPDIPI